MPSLLRLLFILAVIFGAGYGVIYALAHLGAPKPREITVTIPQDRFYKQR
jgi:phage shock protein PspC (stress-responsive transcriptional regulator)